MLMTMNFGVAMASDAFAALPSDAARAGATTTTTAAGAVATRRADVEGDEPDNAFARLAGLVRSNEGHLAELKALNDRLAEAKAYLETPSANLRLGLAYLDRVRMQRSRVLACLRANRVAAREFLAD